ncbi:lipopolysaccharide biosynthesis protein [Microbacterium esteraromaticum]|nr:lipopolysaccharide biosynthesis protein [Microbacterium esteraromaticum]
MTSQDHGHLGGRAARSAARLLGGQSALFVIQLTSIVVLARLLTPQEYGIVAMALAFTGFGHLLRDVGLSSAAIQAPTLSHAQRSNLFWINTGIGAAMATVVMVLAPVIAIYYAEPTVLWIVLGFAPTLLLSGMATQLRAHAVRTLQLGRLALVDVTSALLGLASAILLAYAGGGAWALVIQQLVGGLCTLILMLALGGWMPGWIHRGVPMRAFFAFGVPLFGSQLLTYFASNLDSMLMGRHYGSVLTGLYNRSLQLVRVPMNQLRSPLGQLALSVLSRIQSDDSRLISYVSQGQRAMGYPLLFAAGLLAAMAPAVIDVAIGDQWASAAPFVRLIAVGEGLTTLAGVGGWIYTSRGLGAALLKYTVVSASVKACLLITAAAFGPIWIAAAFAFAPVVLWPLSLIWVGKVANLRTLPLLVNSCRMVAVATIASIAAYFSLEWVLSAGAGSIVGIAAGCFAALITAAAAAVIPAVRNDYLLSFQLVKTAMVRPS